MEGTDLPLSRERQQRYLWKKVVDYVVDYSSMQIIQPGERETERWNVIVRKVLDPIFARSEVQRH